MQSFEKNADIFGLIFILIKKGKNIHTPKNVMLCKNVYNELKKLILQISF